MWLDRREVLVSFGQDCSDNRNTMKERCMCVCVCVCVVRLGATVSVDVFTLSILLCRSHVSDR